MKYDHICPSPFLPLQLSPYPNTSFSRLHVFFYANPLSLVSVPTCTWLWDQLLRFLKDIFSGSENLMLSEVLL